MPYVVVNNFGQGLDTRRHAMTAPPGTLRRCVNAAISRGGEVVKRRAFIPTFALPPAATVGLATVQGQLYVFGSGAAPAMPVGVNYQQLVHPGGVALQRVLSWDIFGKKLYVVAQFVDGSIFHFYDGVRVTDWYDGRSRTSFTILSGDPAPVGGDSVSAITVDGIEILGVAVPWTTDAATTAQAVVDQINAFISTPDYTASRNGNVVNVSTADAGAAANGKVLNVVAASSILVAPTNAVFAGGSELAAAVAAKTTMTISGGAAGAKITSIKAGAVEIMGGAGIAWTTDAAMATAVAAQINTLVSVPNYDATAAGNVVTITASDTGIAANGLAVTATITGTLTVTPNPATLTGGATTQFVPGNYVKTAQTKMYATSGSVMHFSGVEQPTKWTTDVIGAGFINMENQDGQSEQLVSMERYFSMMAVFGRRSVQIWKIDVDPALNTQSQVLRNTGTIAAQSVEQVGDNDVFYLSDSGIRSLRARDSSNAAVSNDIGSPIDDLVESWVAAVGAAQVAEACAVIDPIMGRYWLAIGGTIFVLSRYPGNKITAWSTYQPGFVPEAFAVIADNVYVRSGDTIYLLGGSDSAVIDESLVEIELPLIDAEKPAHFKKWSALDCVVEGHWRVYAGFDPLNPQARELIAQIDSPTLSMQRIGLEGYGTHASIKFENDTAEPARVCNFIIHFELADVG